MGEGVSVWKCIMNNQYLLKVLLKVTLPDHVCFSQNSHDQMLINESQL